MEALSILLIGTALAMDSFSVSITVGANMRHIRPHQSVVLALYFGVFQAGMTLIGGYGGMFLGEFIDTFDHWVALALLGLIGGKMIYESFQMNSKTYTSLNHKVLIGLALATSIDAMGVGLSYALLNKPVFIASVLIGVIAFVLTYLGVYLGKTLHKNLSSHMEFIGGAILIAIGVKIAFDHGVL